MRGVFATFLGARLNGGVKTVIFGLFVGVQGPFRVNPGVAAGAKI